MRVQAESFWYLNLGNVKERLRKSYFQRCGQPKGETQCAGDQKHSRGQGYPPLPLDLKGGEEGQLPGLGERPAEDRTTRQEL